MNESLQVDVEVTYRHLVVVLPRLFKQNFLEIPIHFLNGRALLVVLLYGDIPWHRLHSNLQFLSDKFETVKVNILVEYAKLSNHCLDLFVFVLNSLIVLSNLHDNFDGLVLFRVDGVGLLLHCLLF